MLSALYFYKKTDLQQPYNVSHVTKEVSDGSGENLGDAEYGQLNCSYLMKDLSSCLACSSKVFSGQVVPTKLNGT